jgi:hypothetical protein
MADLVLARLRTVERLVGDAAERRAADRQPGAVNRVVAHSRSSFRSAVAAALPPSTALRWWFPSASSGSAPTGVTASRGRDRA